MFNEDPIILVVDDDSSVRTATQRVLRSAGYQVRTFASTQQLLAHGRPSGPCCVILDLCMPDENGLQFQTRLLHSGIRVPIIFISGHGDVPASVQAMKSGAINFLPKPYDAQVLLAAVAEAVAADSRQLSMDQHLVELRERFQTLTAREVEVLAAVAAGLLNKQVAADLGITEKTVKVHRAQVMEKMRAVSVTDLVRMADSLGLQWSSQSNTAAYTEMVELNRR